MPEATIYEDGKVVFSEKHVRMSGNVIYINAIAITFDKELMTKKHLWFCSPALDCSHVLTALLFGQSISHLSLYPIRQFSLLQVMRRQPSKERQHYYQTVYKLGHQKQG